MSTTTTTQLIAAGLLLLSGFLSSTSAPASMHIDADHTPNDFVTKWRIPAGADEERTLTFPGVGSYTINWGDGMTDVVRGVTDPSNYPNHPYPDIPMAHDYEIVVSSVSAIAPSTITHITHFNLNRRPDRNKLIDVQQWGTARWTSMQGAFHGASNMTMSATDAPNLSNVSSMDSMFRRAEDFDTDINHWNVGNVSNMSFMFSGVTAFNQNLPNWNVANVSDMSFMFNSAVAFNGNIGDWNVAKVEGMNNMFSNARAFNQNLNTWNVGSVTNMSAMFSNAIAFNENISLWNVSRVTNMGNMFEAALVFNQNIGNWNVSNVENMQEMFEGATFFDQNIGNWNVSSVMNMDRMFDGAGRFNQNLGSWYIVPTTTATTTSLAAQNGVLRRQNPTYRLVTGAGSTHNHLFTLSADTTTLSLNPNNPNLASGTYKLRVASTGAFGSNNAHSLSINIVNPNSPTNFVSQWSIPAGTDVERSLSFPGGGSYTIDWGDTTPTETANGAISHTYASAGDYTVTTASTITRFNLNNGADKEKLIAVTRWGSANWSSMETAFYGASNLTSVSTDAPNLSSVSNMSGMFQQASAFSATIGGWNVSSVVDMSNMFNAATSFNGDIGNWNVASVSNMSNMFNAASDFSAAIGGWNVSNVVEMSNMFNAATSFNGDIGSWNVAGVSNMSNMFQQASTFNANIASWNVASVSNMGNMFNAASDFSAAIGGWNVASVSNMSNMFNAATSFNSAIGSWNVASVTDMTDMFTASGFSQNLGRWYVVPNVGFTITLEAQNAVLNAHNRTYTLVAGAGDSGNNLFTLSGATLIPKATTSFGIYELRLAVRGPDVFGNDNVAMLSINHANTNFISQWRIPAGDNAARTFSFPGEGSYTIDWGDGSQSQAANGAISHTYATTSPAAAVDYTVTASNTITRFNLNNGADKEKLINVQRWGTARWSSMETAFYGASAMTMSASDAPNLAGVSTMQSMFQAATAFNSDISAWNVASVENMGSMFNNAAAFEQNIGAWNVSGVRDMNSMFNSAAAFNQDLSTWNVSSVTDMSSMFDSAAVFNQNLNTWNVSSVVNMSSMFDSAAVFNQNLSAWDVSSVVNMSSMFDSAAVFNQDISVWNVSKVANMEAMFDNADAFSQNLGYWYVSDTSPSAKPTLIPQNDVLIAQGPIYTLLAGDGDGNNDLFTLNSRGRLNPSDPRQLARVYSLRIGISGAATFGSENTTIIALTSTVNPDGTILYAITVPRDAKLTIAAAAAADVAAAAAAAKAEAQIVNAVLPQLLRAATKMTVDNISQRIDQALDASGKSTASLNIGGNSNLQQLFDNNIRTVLQNTLDVKQILNNSSFLIPLNLAAANNKGLNTMTLWGSADYLSLSDNVGDDAAAVDWEAEVIGFNVGIDARLKPHLLAGAALAYSAGDASYQRNDASNSINSSSSGSLSNTLFSVHPYMAYKLSQGQLWGSLGIGQGELVIDDKAINDTDTFKSQRDTQLFGLALGGNRQLSSNANWLSIPGTTTLELKGEVSLSTIKLAKSQLSDSQALTIAAHRYRMALEASQQHTLAGGGSVSPSIELGIRYDAGSGETTGGGVELAGNYRYTSPKGLEMQIRAHTLLLHQSDYQEWGLSGLVKYQASRSGQGLRLSLQPAWGQTPSNVADRIWQTSAVTDYANATKDVDSSNNKLQLNSELGYGLPGPYGQGLLTPYAGLGIANAQQSYNIGARWTIDQKSQLNLIGERKQSGDSIQLRGDFSF